MDVDSNSSRKLAEGITRAASTQTYYTIRYLVDRELVDDAYRAYAYFRRVDDYLDAESGTLAGRIAFLRRQQILLDACYRGEAPAGVSADEQILVDLVRHDREENSGLQSYLRNMMAVMAFDVERRGRIISQAELSAYSHRLSTAVMDALLYFIGHQCIYPGGEERYLAVEGAHIIHMLRDMLEDAAIGYFNIPRETIEEAGISFQDVSHQAYRRWVHARVMLAVHHFRIGREYISGLKNLRCRLAGYAYIARFEWMVHLIIKDNYRLRAEYSHRKSLQAALWMTWNTLTSLLGGRGSMLLPRENALRFTE